MNEFSAAIRARVRRSLLTWYRRAKRDLPWRRTRDPYRIWVSEIMLQQTRVETVIPYYERFLRHFPTVRRLASASLGDVLKRWEGLGYYSRARNLHLAAQHIVGALRGQIPRTAEGWRRLPGVGRYTAAAIASIAFNEPVPALDGNIRRVLARLYAVREALGAPETEARLWREAQALLAPRAAGDFNQAMMELGATVCLPRTPRCEACPLAEACRAAMQGIAAALPAKRRRQRAPVRRFAVVAARRGTRLLVARRPPRGLLGGLWGLPTAALTDGESAEAAAARMVREELRVRAVRLEEIGDVEHVFTHFRMQAKVFFCDLEGDETADRAGDPSQTWASPEALRRLPFATVDRKMLTLLEESRAQLARR